MENSSFDIKAFADLLGFRPWPYSAGTFTDGAGRFVDWEKGTRLLGPAHSDLLFSEHTSEQPRPLFWPFPAPKSLADAVEAAVAMGWYTR